MSWVVPPALEDAIYAATAATIPGINLAPSQLAKWIVDRSTKYTTERHELERLDRSDGDLAARATFFTICDAMKLAIPLGELAGRGALPAHRPLRVVDVGAGCGAMTLGLIASVAPGHALDVHALDRDARALQIATRAATAFAKARDVPLAIATRTCEVATAPIPAADLVVIGSVLNELPDDARGKLVERALAALAPDGALILIEPALRETSRALHALRDAIVAAGRAHVFAPCTRQATCPALVDERDWCHEDRALALPARTAQLSRATHLRDGGMRFSYLVLRRAPRALVEATTAWRIVSAPHVQKGKHEVWGCSTHGRITIRLLKRHRTSATRVVEAAQRGDVLVLDAAPDDDRVEVLATTAVAHVEPAKL